MSSSPGPPCCSYTLVKALAPWITKKFAHGELQSTGTPFPVLTLLVWVLQNPDTLTDWPQGSCEANTFPPPRLPPHLTPVSVATGATDVSCLLRPEWQQVMGLGIPCRGVLEGWAERRFRGLNPSTERFNEHYQEPRGGMASAQQKGAGWAGEIAQQ